MKPTASIFGVTRRNAACLTLGLLMFTAAWAPAHAGTSPPTAVVASYKFSSSDSGLLVVRGSVQARSRDALVASVIVFGDAPATQTAGGAQIFELPKAERPAQTYGPAGSTSLCPLPLVCNVSRHGQRFEFTYIYDIRGEHQDRTPVTLYILAAGDSPTISDVTKRRWTAQARDSRFGRIIDTHTSAVGISSDAGSFEGTLGLAGAPGDSAGSVAVAVPPCESGGVGLLRLSGGSHTSIAICPSSPIAAVAAGRTQWRISGLAGGITRLRTRLLILPTATR